MHNVSQKVLLINDPWKKQIINQNKLSNENDEITKEINK